MNVIGTFVIFFGFLFVCEGLIKVEKAIKDHGQQCRTIESKT